MELNFCGFMELNFLILVLFASLHALPAAGSHL